MLHIDGLRKLLATPAMPGIDNAGQGQWPQRILDEVTAYRGGLPPDDDTLAIEIYRPLAIEDPNAFDPKNAQATSTPEPAEPAPVLSP